MATSQNMNIDSLFHPSQAPATDPISPMDSEFFHDEIGLEMSRSEASGSSLNSMFTTDTSDWVSAQSALVPISTGFVTPSEASYSQTQDHVTGDHWASIAGSRSDSIQLDNPWTLAAGIAPNMAPSVSEFTQWADTISSSSSPITSASMGEIEDSCSPELVMPPLTITPSVYDPMSIQTNFCDLQDQWTSPSHGFPSDDSAKPSFDSVETNVSQVTGSPLEHPGRRQSNDSDPQKARSDFRYRLGPGADGFYHCPFEGCSHGADKLKCNYDKHLDSHLKPYRCKVKACQETAFSSTACVLRHEREAHGMHGHGNKPFICMYQDCERSSSENGFPRRWNLHDHMRRMHGYTPKAIKSEDTHELLATGPTRTKRIGRTSPKPRLSKDETVKVNAKKSKRSSIPKGWLEQQAVCHNPAIYDISYSQTPVETSQMTPVSLYARWSHTH